MLWLDSLCDEVGTTVVSIDGETLCGSAKQGAHTVHLLSVISHELGITLTQLPVSNKTNIISGALQILQSFDVRRKVVTTDALLTQHTFCQDLCDAETDHLMLVKKNRDTLFDEF